MSRACVPASQAPPAITTEEVLQAARLAFSSPWTRIGPVALRPRLPTGLPFQEHLLTRSNGPPPCRLEWRFFAYAQKRGRRMPAPLCVLRCSLLVYGKLLPAGLAVAAASAVQFACTAPEVTPPKLVPGPLDWSWM